MNRLYDNYQSYSWHQSHDQATVLLLVPYETVDDDISVIIEKNYVVAGVRGHAPILKGQLYGTVDVPNSLWQLEPHASRISARERTTSSISTTSTQSSFAVVSDPEISSSFAASLEGALQSDTDEQGMSSPALSSPVSSTIEDPSSLGIYVSPPPQNNSSQRRQNRFTITSHPVSPRSANPPLSLGSSFSSLESLHAGSGRLLTLHLEKAESIIWPSLVVGPVPETLSPVNEEVYPWITADISSTTTTVTERTESIYNMDPTSLVLIALELCDIRDAKDEAFEYFVRAWHQAHVPSATIRLATHYLPLSLPTPTLSPISTPNRSPCATPTLPSALPEFTQSIPPPTPTQADPQIPTQTPTPTLIQTQAQIPGTPQYYLYHIGGREGLAQVYLEAGLLHLEGTAGNLLSASGSYSGLSSIRISTLQIPPPTTTETYNHLSTWGSSGFSGLGSMSGGGGGGGSGAEAWRRDRERARRLFERARRLNGDLDVPLLPPSPDTEGSSEAESVDEEKTELGTRPRSKTRVSGRVGEGKRDSGELGEGQGQGQFRMPRVDIEPTREQEEKQEQRNNEKPIRRRRKREDTIGGGGGRGGRGRGGADSIVEERVRAGDEDDNTWYLYLPGLVGAGTALLVVGFLSFSSWRKGQGS